MTAAPQLSREDMSAFACDAKIGLLATVNPAGLPHVTLITSLQAKSPERLMFGQFSEGLSKKHLRENPRAGWLVMSRTKQLWRGKARWTEATRAGADYELYNHKPMFRYNAYFGIHTVHYLDIVELSDTGAAPAVGMAKGHVLAALASRRAARNAREGALTPWAEQLTSKLGTLKFLAYVGEDGYPMIVPVVPCRPAGRRRLVLAPTVYREELAAIAEDTPVAVYALNLQMESVLVRGRFDGYRRHGGVRAGTIEIDWVYNSMPPKQGQIYPAQPLEAASATNRAALPSRAAERVSP